MGNGRRPRSRLRRFVGWTAALLLVVGGLVALSPSVLTPFVARRLSTVSGADVRVGWISWNPLAGRVVLHRLALAPPAGGPPIVTAQAVVVDVALRRWLDGERALNALVLKRPWVALRRTGPGDFDLATIFAGSRAAEKAAKGGAVAVGPSTPVRIDRLEIVDGSVEFRDETTVPALETSLFLDDATARDLVFASEGTGAIAFHVESRIEEDPLTLDFTYEADADSSHLTATLEATNASLARALLYVPLGWQRTAGTLDAHLTYERRVEKQRLKKHGLTAVLTLHDLALTEPWAPEPMLHAAAVRVPALAVDFIAQRTDLGAIQVTDYQALVLRDENGLHVPLATGSTQTEDSGWETTLDRVALGKGTAVLRRVLDASGPDVRIPVSEGVIRLPDDGVRFNFTGALADGRLTLEGASQGADTTLTFGLTDLALAKAPVRFGLPIAFADGRLDGTLTLRVGDTAPVLSGTLRSRAGRTVPPPAHPEEVLAWQHLTVDIADSTLDPLRLHLRNVEATWPYVMLHRRPDGWFPLTLVGPTPATSDAAAPTAPWLHLDRLTLQGGRIEFYDTTLATAYGIDLTDLAGSAESLTTAPLATRRFELTGALDELSPFTISGTVTAQDTAFGFGVDRLLLPPLNPYLAPLLGYEVRTGLARLNSTVRLTGTSLTADNDLVLSRFAMRAVGKDTVEGTIGAPLSATLALMKDTHGDIHLDLPLQGDVAANQYRVGNLFREALGNALLGTVRGPLGWIRGIFRRDEGERFDLRPVPFPAGEATLGADGDARIAELARLLQRQTVLHAVLLPEPSRADLERLRAEGSAAPLEALADLARRRATAVTERLVSRHAITAERIDTEPWEPAEPRIEGEPGVDVQLRAD